MIRFKVKIICVAFLTKYASVPATPRKVSDSFNGIASAKSDSLYTSLKSQKQVKSTKLQKN